MASRQLLVASKSLPLDAAKYEKNDQKAVINIPHDKLTQYRESKNMRTRHIELKLTALRMMEVSFLAYIAGM